MILLGDKKKAVSAILGPKEGEKKDSPPLSDLEMAAQDLIAAVESKNPGQVASALRACYAACMGEESHGE